MGCLNVVDLCLSIRHSAQVDADVRTEKLSPIKLLQSNWGLRIWIMGHRSSKFNFDLMGNSLSPLHALGKFPEMNRTYLPAVVFTIFKVFRYFFNIQFATTLLLTLNGELD